MARRRYTEVERAEALEVYQRDGLAAAHQACSVPKQTITRWAREAGIDTPAVTVHAAQQTKAAVNQSLLKREQRREEFRTKLLEKAFDALNRMDHPHIDFKGKDAQEVTYPKPSPSGFQAYATAAAILLDKLRLELGEATARQEVMHTADVDGEIERLAREMQDA